MWEICDAAKVVALEQCLWRGDASTKQLFFACVSLYASVERMGGATVVLFFWGGGWRQCLNWTDARVWRRQALAPVRGGGGVYFRVLRTNLVYVKIINCCRILRLIPLKFQVFFQSF